MKSGVNGTLAESDENLTLSFNPDLCPSQIDVLFS